MAAAGGSQCGYCTPGFVMSLFAEQYRPGRAGPAIRWRMAGNLCRCTGYRPIRDAALALGPAPPGPLRDRLEQPAAARSSASACAASRGRRRSTSASRCWRPIPAATARRRRHRSRRRIEPARTALAAPRQRRGDRRAARVLGDTARVRIGAALPLDGHRAAVARRPDGRGASGSRSSPRRRSAIAPRSAATSRPPRRSATPRRCSWRSTRSVHVAGPSRPAARCRCRRFFTGYRQTALAPGEMLTAVEIPQAASRSTCASTRWRSAGSTTSAPWRPRWPSIATPAGRVRRARFAFGGVAATPVRVGEAEDARSSVSRGTSGRRARAGASSIAR